MNSLPDLTSLIAIIKDIFAFPGIPLKSSVYSDEEYEKMGQSASAVRVIGLSMANSFAFIFGLYATVGYDPYIPLGRDLNHFPFILTFVFLALVSFLVNIMVQFLCFRIVSGKGNLVGHGYLTALSTTNIALLFWLSIVILNLEWLSLISMLVFGIGGIYLIYPSFTSIRAFHRISRNRAFVGLFLSAIAFSPVFILYLFLLTYFGESYPYQIYHWGTMAVLSSLLFVGLLVLAYILWHQTLEGEYTEGVPIRQPFHQMVKVRWMKLPLGFALFFVVLFSLMAIAFPHLIKDTFPPETSFIVPTLFLVLFVLIYGIWMKKLVLLPPGSSTL